VCVIMIQRRRKKYFQREIDAPKPVSIEVKKRVSFSETDPMAIVWHGRYPQYFEMGSEELGRYCGLSYADFFESGLRVPIVQLHVDYFKPLILAELVTVRASYIWNDGARLNTEYLVLKEDGSTAASGYTVQMFVDAKSGKPYMVVPQILERCRKRWRLGELYV